MAPRSRARHALGPDPRVRIADRFHGRAKAWHRFLQDSGGKADLIVRMKWNRFHLTAEDDAPFDLIEHLTSLPDDQLPLEVAPAVAVAAEDAVEADLAHGAQDCRDLRVKPGGMRGRGAGCG
jgi:hypothetical protein